ncbi:MAG: helix-turn-helix domain-containing protein [Treponema sp.]|jgi:transcriptional regulator with XRE-family HTH domain|nr:helix-turn-helix domain-containing protein [Treponema sp.]
MRFTRRELNNLIGGKICKYREDALLTQEDLAQKLEVARTTICHWENGKQSISLYKLYQICEILAVSISSMLPDNIECIPPQRKPSARLSVPRDGITRGKVNYAIRQAMNNFDRWNDATGQFVKFTSYYHEAQACIEDAVKIGIMVACDIEIEFDKEGLIDKPEPMEDR